MAEEPVTVPRGRHAPPLEVRREVQLQRLFQAAAKVFSEVGYAEASAEAISKEAGMSKATFYEHFANKEECILALTTPKKGGGPPAPGRAGGGGGAAPPWRPRPAAPSSSSRRASTRGSRG